MIRSVKKAAVVLLACLAFYAVAGFFVLPAMIKTVLQDRVRESSGLSLQVERVTVNPFTLSVDLLGTEIAGRGRLLFFRAPRVRADFSSTSLLQRTIAFDAIRIESPLVSLRSDGNGIALAQTLPDAGHRVSIGLLDIMDGRVRLVDETGPEKKVLSGFEQIVFHGKDLANKDDRNGSFTLAFQGAGGGRYYFDGMADIPGLSAAGKYRAERLPAPALSAWLGPLRKLAVPAGTASLAGEYHLSVVDGAVRLELNDSGAAMKAAAVDVGEKFVFRLQDITMEFDAVLSATGETTSVIFPLLSVQAGTLYLSDQNTTEAPVELVFRRPAVVIRNLGSGPDLRAEFELDVPVNHSGLLRGQGWFEPASRAAQLDLVIRDMDLRPLHQYLYLLTPLELISATLTADIRLLFEEGLRSIKGSIETQDVEFVETGSDEPVLTLERMSAGGIAVTEDALDFSLESITLDGLYLDLETDTAGRLNLYRWFDFAAVLPDERSLTVSIGQLELDDGLAGYTDFTLTPVLHVSGGELAGAVSAVRFSCRPAGKPCALDTGHPVFFSFHGLVNSSGTGLLSGRVRQKNSGRESQVSIALDGMDAALLSPYSGRYLGRGIEQGTFNLDLVYHAGDGRYDGRYRIRLDGIVPGEPVYSPQALPLSLDMALALLRDSSGSVDLVVPFSGISGAGKEETVRMALIAAFPRTLADIVDKPFQELGKLLGVDGDSLKAIPFEPGSAEVTAAGLDTLTALSEALQQRPGLGLAVTAGYDGETDRKALAFQQVRLHVLLAASIGPPGRTGGSIDFSNPRIQEVLDEFALSRLGIHPGQAGTGGEDYYKDVFMRLVSAEEISQSALESLARYRRRSIIGRLESLGIPQDRLRDKGPAPGAGRDNGGVLAGLELFPVEQGVPGRQERSGPG